ncbi:hypothetical protein FRC12_024103 [Ceratobasidium sp. 428]|nr:hypothetical protein FRC12_024103 [Ceratobasidium sp. 428]
MLAVATAYDALRAHLARKPSTPSSLSGRWRPYHSRKVSSGITPDDTESPLPTPQSTVTAQRPVRKATRQQPAPAPVQDPEGLIDSSLSLLSSVYDQAMVARASHQSSHNAAAALPTPPASPTPQAHAQAIAPHVMHWFIVELLRRSHTSAVVIRAALAYITAAAPAIRSAIEEGESDPEIDTRTQVLFFNIHGLITHEFHDSPF